MAAVLPDVEINDLAEDDQFALMWTAAEIICKKLIVICKNERRLGVAQATATDFERFDGFPFGQLGSLLVSDVVFMSFLRLSISNGGAILRRCGRSLRLINGQNGGMHSDVVP